MSREGGIDGVGRGWGGSGLECANFRRAVGATARSAFYTDLAHCRMDIIFIAGLRASTLIGIYPREKAMPQTIEISLQIGTSTASAGASDDIGDTIDYATVAERLRSELAARDFNLLERLAEFVATLLLEDFGAAWVA